MSDIDKAADHVLAEARKFVKLADEVNTQSITSDRIREYVRERVQAHREKADLLFRLAREIRGLK